MRIILILLLAFFARLVSIDQSLWLDEATTALVVKNLSFREIINKFSPFDFHPPGYYLFLRGWLSIFGVSEISLRLPSVFFSLGTGFFIYIIARKLFSKKVGLWAMIFYLFNPLVIYYSQEARMYSMAVFFVTLALGFFLAFEWQTKDKEVKNTDNGYLKPQELVYPIGFSFFSILAFLTFYGVIFFILAVVGYWIGKKKFKPSLVFSIFFGVSLSFLLPLLLTQWRNSFFGLETVKNWSAVLGQVNLKNLILIPIKFLTGRISFFPKWLYYLVIGGWFSLVWGWIFWRYLNLNKSLRKKLSLLFLVFFLPIFLGLVFSLISPMLQYFRFLYLLPVLSLILAVLAYNKKFRLIIFLGFVIFSLLYLFGSQFHREDWRSLSLSLAEKDKIYIISTVSDPIRYYRPDIAIIPLEGMVSKKKFPKESKILVVPYATDIWGLDYQAWLFENKYQKTNQINFRGVFVEVYQR